MSLEHVMEWKEERGWRWINAEEAAKRYSTTVSRDDHIFKCSVCNEYLTLAYPETYSPYFTHTSASTSNCDDKSGGLFSAYQTNHYSFVSENRRLPLRLIVDHTRQSYSLQLGLSPLPTKLFESLENLSDVRLEIYAQGRSEASKKYKLKGRLNEFGTTYFDVGVLAAQYEIRLRDASQELQEYWAQKTDVLEKKSNSKHDDAPKGTFFDVATGKAIPHRGDIVVGRDYYYLCRSFFIYSSSTCASGITYDELCFETALQKNSFTPRLYKVVVSKFTRETFDAIEKCGRRLVCAPPQLLPAWPPYVANSNLVFNSQSITNNYWLFIQGDVECRCFPIDADVEKSRYPDPNYNECWQDEGKPNADYYLTRFKIKNVFSPKIIAAGREREIVKSLCYWGTELDQFRRDATPTIKIATDDGTDLSQIANYEREPKKIIVETEYDGFIDVEENGRIVNRVFLDAKTPREIREIRFGQKIVVWQGRDRTYELSFSRRKSVPQTCDKSRFDERKLVCALNRQNGAEIPVSWKLRRALTEVRNFPILKSWLVGVVRKGRAPAGAERLALRSLDEFKGSFDK